MKHLKFLPFLIAAASYMPRAHAVEVVQSVEPSGVSMLLICLGLVLLSAAAPRHSAIVKPEQQ